MRTAAWLLLPIVAALSVQAEPQAFVHAATPANIAGDATYMDHPSTTRNELAQITLNTTAGNVNPHPLGVKYDGLRRQQAIVNLNGAAFMRGTAYDVIVPDGPPGTTWWGVARGTASSGGAVVLSRRESGDPSALVFVTQRVPPSGVRNNARVGVAWNATRAQWTIFNENNRPIPDGAEFIVTALPASRNVFVHRARRANSIFSSTLIDAPATNDNPAAVLVVTHNATPDAGTRVAWNRPFGVYYAPEQRKWAIASQDGSPIPDGTAFNVYAVDPTPASGGGDPGDLVVDGIEVTQAVQRYPENSIPLVGYKSTAVRVYVHGRAGTRGPWRATAILSVRNVSGTHAGGPIRDRALRPVNGAYGILTTTETATGRDSLDNSFLFLLDADQTAPGERELSVELLSNEPRPENDLTNNRRAITVRFNGAYSRTMYGARWANGTSMLPAAPFSDFEPHRRIAENMHPLARLAVVPLPGDPAPTFRDTDGAITIGGRRLVIAVDAAFDPGGDLLAVGNDVCISIGLDSMGRMTGPGSVVRDRVPGAFCGAITEYARVVGAYEYAHAAISRTVDSIARNAFAYILQPEASCPCGWCCSGSDGNMVARGQNVRGNGTGITMGHELGHALGFGNHHVVSETHPADVPVPDYPHDHASIGSQFGFRFRGIDGLGAPQVVVPSSGMTHVHDVMSYGAAPRWISPFTYCRLLNFLSGGTVSCDSATQRAAIRSPYVLARLQLDPQKAPDRNRSSAADSLLYVSGILEPNGTATFLPFEISPQARQPAKERGDRFLLVLEAGSGTTLATKAFGIVSDDPNAAAPFSVVMPWAKGTRKIALYDGKKRVAERAVSPNAPRLAVPAFAKLDANTTLEKLQSFSWKASDVDGGALTYSVQYSADGKQWLPVATMLTKKEASVDFSNLPGSDAASLRILATDGVNTSIVTSPAFRVPRRGPRLALDANATLAEASAYDWEDGPITDPWRFRWEVDGVDAGSGFWLVLANRALKRGNHTITVRVSDDDNNIAEVSHTVALP